MIIIQGTGMSLLAVGEALGTMGTAVEMKVEAMVGTAVETMVGTAVETVMEAVMRRRLLVFPASSLNGKPDMQGSMLAFLSQEGLV